MKSKTFLNSIAASVVLLFPIAAHSQIVFSDSFETYGDQTNLGGQGGYVFTSNNPVGGGSNGSFAIDIDQTDYSFGYDTTAGHKFALFHFDGTPNGTSTAVSLALTKANTGVAITGPTTYTLTYLAAPTSLPLTLSLTLNGVVVATESNAATGDNTFSAGIPVVFNTLGDPSAKNGVLGVEASVAGDVGYDRYVAFDNLVITASKDTNAPEPSSYALMFAGLLALLALKIRSTVVRS